MGRRGPKPKPTAYLKLVGGRSRAFPPVDQSPPAAPPMPRGLSYWARAEWRRVVPLLLDAGTLSTLDLAALTLYCEGWSSYRMSLRDGDERARARAGAHLLKIITEFGLSPRSRVRVPKRTADPLTEFVKAKTRGAAP